MVFPNQFSYTTQLIERCNECGSDDIIEDRKQGDVVCRNCGLVLSGHIVDFSSEWRSFGVDQKVNDPNRVGGPLHPLLESSIGTLISKGLRGANTLNERLVKTQNQNRIQRTDRFLIQVFNKIIIFLEKALLSQGLKEKIEELFKLYFDHLTLRKNGTRIKHSLRTYETLSIIAASIFIVCRNEGIPRTFKEISDVTKVPKKDIGSRVRAIEKSLWGIRICKNRNPENFVSRFCMKLGLPSCVWKLAEKVAEVVRDKDGLYGRTYISVAAAAIYIVSQLPFCDLKCSLKEIAEIAGISEITIRSAHKAMYPYRKEILKHLSEEGVQLENSKTPSLFISWS